MKCNGSIKNYLDLRDAGTGSCLDQCLQDQQECGEDCCAPDRYCGADGGCIPKTVGLPPPDFCDGPLPARESDTSSGAGSGFTVGDPVVIASDSAYSLDRLEDVAITTPAGRFAFYRSYYSSDEPWRGVTSSLGAPVGDFRLAGVPKPFGSSRVNRNSLRWTHSLFSFVDVRASASGDGGAHWVVRPPVGTQEQFDRCPTAPCWAPNEKASPGQRSRLYRRSDGTFEYHQGDGKLYVYEGAIADGGMYFLSEIGTDDGQVVALIDYANPGSCAALSSGGVPWVSQVHVGGTHALTFNYATKASLDAGDECVLSSIVTGSSPTTLVTYTYEQNKAGLVSQVVTPAFEEDFSYDGGFKVLREGVTVVNHTGTNVSAAADRTGNLTVSTPVAGDVYSNGTACSTSPAGMRSVANSSPRAGNGDDVSAGLVEDYTYMSGRTLMRDTSVPLKRVDSCSGSYPYSCSPGSIHWVSIGVNGIGTTCSESNPGYHWATKNKRDNWTVTPTAPPDGGPNSGFERTALWVGVPNALGSNGSSPNPLPSPGINGANALERTEYTYAYQSGSQSVATERRRSALSTDGGVALTTYVRDSSNRPVAQYQSGVTQLIDGSLEVRVVGRFLTYSSSRLASESGPCIVANTGVTSCGTGSPLTSYGYFTSGEFNNGRVQTVTRSASATGNLVTTYGDYTAMGEPGFIVDENGVRTDLTYIGHNVTQRSVELDGGGTLAWNYTWENEKLTAVQFPETNYETYCYRAVTTAAEACDSNVAWTGRLQRVSRATSVNGSSGWTEATLFGYWGDGTLKSEARYTNNSGTAEPRFKRAYAADAHKRQTLVTIGNTNTFSEARGYDGADNLAVLGPASNGPPSWCRATGGSDGSSGSLSRLCAQMGYDRAERLRQLDLFADSSSATPIRACIDYDMQGNVSRVTSGCSSSDTCSMEATGSTCGGAAGLSQDYLTDDFGNVVQVQLVGSDNGSGGRGTFRYEYDARGSLVKQQSEAQRTDATARYVVFDYDRLGRRTKTSEYRGGVPSTVLTWAYDGDTDVLADPPTDCGGGPVATQGRLRAVRDPAFTRWYQYDSVGRVTKEVRRQNGGNPAECGVQIHLVIEYSPNGNSSVMHYGNGRVVSYTYGSGAGKDRVDSIGMNYFLTDGGVEQRQLVSNVQWEPYGSLRKYRLEPEGIWVDYEKGSAQTTPGSHCPTGALSETVDQTDRLRSLRVWTSARELYRRTYVWKADEVERIDSCYLGGGSGGTEYLSEVYSPDAGDGVGYDGLGRLKGAASPTFASVGAPMSQRKYSYDGRGNVTSVAGDSVTYTAGYDTSSANRRDWLTSFGTDSWNHLELLYDRDGRVLSMVGPDDSPGIPTAMLHPGIINFDYAGTDVGPGSDTVMRGLQIRSHAAFGSLIGFFYSYDALERRASKHTPVTNYLYMYDLGHRLLWSFCDSGPTFDEYVWLGDLPVAAIRSTFDFAPGLPHHPDGVGSCSQVGDGVACGVYPIITDHIGKPVLSLDYTGHIAGVGEYDPYGAMNRVQFVGGTPHPYEKHAASMEMFPIQQKKLTGLDAKFRVYFPMIDTDEDCHGTVRDSVGIWNAAGSTRYESFGGNAYGEVWTNWWPADVVSGQSVLNVGWTRDDGNCYPALMDQGCTYACPQATDAGWDYAGFETREYEYARHEPSTASYFPPFRFPGQYWDPEVDLNENWHRYYSPHLGRYLTPEPLLQRPNHLLSEASQGSWVATYAYAANNPITGSDPTGLYKLSGTCPNYKSALALAQKIAGCGARKGGGTDTTCKCQVAISKVTGGCDVCPFLVDGSGPDLLPKLAWYEDRAHTNVGEPNAYNYKTFHTEPNSVAVGSRFCTEPFLGSNVRDLALLLLHEAAHYCSSVNGGIPTPDPDTKNAADECFK